MSAGRSRNDGPVARQFVDLGHLPPEERRQELMLRLETVWNDARARTYCNLKGKEINQPDAAVMLKVVQAVAVLQGLTGEPTKEEQGRLERLTDAQLLTEATKRLPPAQLTELADQLIRMREQQLKPAIETTGESNERKTSSSSNDGPEDPQPGPPKPGAKWA